ncbi:MAG: DedA family protein, partial [candidate division KSB1 bacterium]|nr:DedA family protein [candidate division KSB1 bacterium]
FIGTLFGDQLFFFMGRFKGKQFLDRRPKWRLRAEKAQRLLERHQTLIIIAFRFIYGIRTVTPFVLGMSNVRTWRFVVLNILSALGWATAIGSAGYFFGLAMEALLDDLKRYEKAAIFIIAIAGLVLWLIQHWRNKHR